MELISKHAGALGRVPASDRRWPYVGSNSPPHQEEEEPIDFGVPPVPVISRLRIHSELQSPPHQEEEEPIDFGVPPVPVASRLRVPSVLQSDPITEILPGHFDPSDKQSWDDRMEDPYLWRSREAPTAPGEQDKKLRRNWFPIFELEVPSLFTVFDAFELTAWDSSQTIAAASNEAQRVNQGQGQGKGNGPNPERKNIRHYGQYAWIPGLAEPWGPGQSPPWGPSGTPPGPRIDHFSSIWNQSFHQNRLPILSLEEVRPTMFLPERMKVDWEPPFSRPVFKRPPKPIEQLFFLDDQEEDVISSAWDVPFSLPVPGAFLTIDVDAHFVNLTTDEDATLIDKWDNPLMRLLPVVPKLAISPWPFAPTDQPPILDDLGIDHWWTALSHPIWPGHALRLDIGILNPEPVPDEELLPTRIPWDTPISYPVWPVRGVPLDSRENWTNLQTEEVILITSYETVLTNEVPWRPKMPIALFPFRLVVEEEAPEDITLDKWYSPFSQNFLKLPPSPLPQLSVIGQPEIVDTITLDMWYGSGAYPDYTDRALRAVTGPEGQSTYWTIITAPWIQFSNLDPNPIPDIPGVTTSYWFTPLSIPLKLFTSRKRDEQEFLRLYAPHQDFPEVERLSLECENPRRRVSRRTGSCGV
jgi:hypothetical protein